MKELYQIGTKVTDPIHSTKEWKSQAVGKIICPECNSIDRIWYPKPINVQLRFRPSFRVNDHIWFYGIEIFHRNFVEIIDEYLNSFVIGKCFDATGKEIKEYLTIYTNKWIVIRGEQGSDYRICNRCASISRGFVGKYYTLKDYVNEGHVFQDRYSCLYIDEVVKDKLDLSPWPDAVLEPVPVLEDPLDDQHLPCDPPHIVEKYPNNFWKYSVDKDVVEKIQAEFGLKPNEYATK